MVEKKLSLSEDIKTHLKHLYKTNQRLKTYTILQSQQYNKGFNKAITTPISIKKRADLSLDTITDAFRSSYKNLTHIEQFNESYKENELVF